MRRFRKPVKGKLFQRFESSRLRQELNIKFMENNSTVTVPHNMVTTGFELDNFRITKNLGVSRGIIVRSRSIFGTIGAGLQTLFGGNITLYSELCEKTREDAFDLMLKHAADLGANAVIGARYDATEIMQGVTEVLAYGTAVVVEPK